MTAEVKLRVYVLKYFRGSRMEDFLPTFSRQAKDILDKSPNAVNQRGYLV